MSLKHSAGELAFRLKICVILTGFGAVAGAGGYLYWLGSTANDTSAWGVIEWGRLVVHVLSLPSEQLQVIAKPALLAALAGVLLLIIPFIILIVKKQGVNHG